MKKYYILLVFGIVFAFVVSIALIVKMDRFLYASEIEKIEQSYTNIEEKLDDFKDDKDTLLRMISEQNTVENFLDTHDASLLGTSQSFFENLVKGHEVIMQLRLLDTEGHELIRVDRTSSHQIVQIAQEELQDKSDRDYFIEFSKLKKGEVDFSSLDLNVEHDSVEIPWRPTLRMAAPVFVDTKRVGMVIINYCMEHWLDDLQKTTLNNFYLVDADGYFIVHPDDKWKWSRYQSPSKKMELFFGEKKDLKRDFEGIKISDNLFVKKLDFFNDEHMLAIYEPKIPLSQLLIDKAMQVAAFMFIGLLGILIPLAILVIKFIKNLKTQRENLERSQNYISKILDNTFDAMFVINRFGIIQKVNSTAEKLFSYKEEELLGKNIKILVPEPHHSAHDGYLMGYKDDGKSRVIGEERELYAVDKYEKLIPISLSVTKMQQDGELFFIGAIRDYTQLRESQEKQRTQEAMLLQQSKFAAMGEMLSAIAHQWRQPLNSIGLIVQDLVSAEKYGELNSEYFTKSKDGIMKQLHLMSDTIDEFRNFFSKTNVKKSFNVIDSIEELRHLYWAQFNAHNIAFELYCKNADDIPTLCNDATKEEIQKFDIESFSSELKQILLNLVANANDAIISIDNANEYQKKISVYLEATEENIRIEISDNAGGMDEEIAKKVFEPYFTTKEMGTGLGLFIVKTLLDKHLHGTIECKRNETVFDGAEYAGTTFSLTIPKNVKATL
ncbi:MAG: PAS domain S-box protein [Sulfurimonas sp.]|nr:PAS domain S-box protein [Sulfurimonas sp.]